MRFRKGTRVEVMKNIVTPVAWHEAEILTDYGHAYDVMYVHHPETIISELEVERVSGKFVRPCPPPTQGKVTWTVGDVVEVFEDFSWKIASILEVFRGDYFRVRLLGTSTELTVHKLNVRERRLWQDGKWILMGKRFGACRDLQDNKFSSSNINSKNLVPESKKRKQFAVCLDTPKDDVLQNSNKVSSRSQKRASPYCSTVIESQTGNMHKIRVVQKACGKQMVNPNLSAEKHLEFSLEDVVDLPSAYSWAKVGGKYTLAFQHFSGQKLEACIPCFQSSSEIILGFASLFLGIYSGTLRASTFLRMIMASPCHLFISG